MSESLALYRKYRSATFAEVIGQEHITTPLSTALAAGRINHAYLFSGPRGCGKTSSARILARSLNCIEGPTPTPCGVCDSCRELAPNGSGSIDVIEIDAASHGGVDDARDLRERAYFAPVRDRYKVYIIDEAHMVTTQGFNALLKLVEEPPDFLVFIFATTEPDKVLQTIRSRTHHYPFRLIPPGVLRAHLERICAAEGVTIEEAVYPLVVRAGGGSARDSLSLLDQLLAGAGPDGVTYQNAVSLLGVTDAALLDDMIGALAVGDAASVYATIDRVVEAGHEPRRFAADLLDRLRDLLILDAVPEAAGNGLLDAPADSMTQMVDQAARIGTATAARYAEIVHTALTDMRGTTAPRLVLELVCARMLLPDASTDAAALLQRLERLERRLELGGGPAATAATGPPATEPVAAAPVAAGPVAAPSASRPSPAPTAESVAEPVAAPSGSGPPSPPGPPGPLDATALRTLWPSVKDKISVASKVTFALIETVQIGGVTGSTVQLVISTPGLARMLADRRHTDVIAAAIGELVGGTWTIEIGVGAAPGSAAPPAPPTPPTPPSPAAPTAGTAPAPPAAAATPPQPQPAPESAWPSVTELPGPSADTGRPASVPGRAPTKASRPGKKAPATPTPSRVKAAPAAAAAPPEPAEPPDPRDEGPADRPDDPSTIGSRHDPEADALALLQSGLGARKLDD